MTEGVQRPTTTPRYPQLRRMLRKICAFSTAAMIIAAVTMFPLAAQAGVLSTFVGNLISTIGSFVTSILGKLLLLTIYLLTWVAQYNNFATSTAVSNGWVIVRDVANMFFIIVLLIIAFGTILNVSSYQWKAMLPRLILAAILINFSKTIAGLLIDFSQVIMLTFVNGFAAAAGGNFASMFQIQNLFALQLSENEVNILSVIGGYAVACLLLTIALVTTLIMTVILTFRIIMLWVLVVLSPLPYLLNLLPMGKKYSEKWWSMFGEYLTVGPVLAFFLWLTLVTAGTGQVSGEFNRTVGGSEAEKQQAAESLVVGGTSAGEPEALLSFLIAIAMLIGGLKITGEMGVMGASAATGAVNKFGSAAKWGAKKFTGYRYASERVGAALAMKEQMRKEKVQAGGAKLLTAYGKGLQGAGKVVALPGRGVARAADWATQRAPKLQVLQFKQQAQKARDAADVARKAGNVPETQKQERRAKRFERLSTAANIVGKGAIVAGGLAVNPLILAGLAPAIARQFQKGGQAAQKAGEGYKYNAVMKSLDTLKDVKRDETMTQINDGTKSSEDRMAAFLRATKQGWAGRNEVKGGEDFLKGLGADKKTLSTFKAYAEEHYAGTIMDRPDLENRIKRGTAPTKELDPEELAADDGDLARQFIVHGTPDQRKELSKSRLHKDKWREGTKKAADKAAGELAALPAAKQKAGDPDFDQVTEDLQKLRVELLRLGKTKDPTTGVEISGLKNSGLDGDLPGLEKAVKSNLSSELLGSIAVDDLALVAPDSTKPNQKTSAALEALAQSIDPTRLTAAIGASRKDEDPSKAVNLRALQEALKNSPRYAQYDQARDPLRAAEAGVEGVQRQIGQKEAQLGRTALGTNAHRNLTTQLAQLKSPTGDLAAAQTYLNDQKKAFDAAMKSLTDASGAVVVLIDAERALYDSLKRGGSKKNP